MAQPWPKRLQLIGYWRSDHDPEWPDVTDWVDDSLPAGTRDLVVEYLEAGARTPWVAAGPSFCRVCGQANGTGERTDGYYVWPEGLAHYVAEHAVRLPAPFEQYALAWAEPESWDVDTRWWAGLASQPGQRDESLQAADPLGHSDTTEEAEEAIIDGQLAGTLTAEFEHGLLIIDSPACTGTHEGWDPGSEPVHHDSGSLYVVVYPAVAGMVTVRACFGSVRSTV